ncbi:hypothetical protein RHMOL_Rhmol01G0040100 [Rhododendron molle]|nr:hypothetical protein RHMOL_Rhmol01G0040100 [Rhododendron molle]
MLIRRSRYFMFQLATEMVEPDQRVLTENERNNVLNNEKYLSDYAMSNEDMHVDPHYCSMLGISSCVLDMH